MYPGIHTPVIYIRSLMIQREAYRFPVKLPVTFSGQRDGTGVLYDVSVKGCRIVSRTPLSVGHALSLLSTREPDALPSPLLRLKSAGPWPCSAVLPFDPSTLSNLSANLLPREPLSPYDHI